MQELQLKSSPLALIIVYFLAFGDTAAGTKLCGPA